MPVRNESVIVERLWHKPLFVLIASALIVFTSFGIRQSFGLFMLPITSDLGWGRERRAPALGPPNTTERYGGGHGKGHGYDHAGEYR